jgi:hypothetical protein
LAKTFFIFSAQPTLLLARVPLVAQSGSFISFVFISTPAQWLHLACFHPVSGLLPILPPPAAVDVPCLRRHAMRLRLPYTRRHAASASSPGAAPSVSLLLVPFQFFETIKIAASLKSTITGHHPPTALPLQPYKRHPHLGRSPLKLIPPPVPHLRTPFSSSPSSFYRRLFIIVGGQISSAPLPSNTVVRSPTPSSLFWSRRSELPWPELPRSASSGEHTAR